MYFIALFVTQGRGGKKNCEKKYLACVTELCP